MTKEIRTCIDCGGALPPHRTRPALRCQDCNRTKRRVKQRPEIQCVDCGVAFYPPQSTGALPERCIPCKAKRKRAVTAARQKAWRAENPERAREHWNRYNRKRLADPEHRRQKRDEALVRNYGITRDEFDDLLAEQGGVCAVCKGERTGPGKVFHVDHDHETGRVRGLLCSRCNTAIGLLNDDPERLRAVIAYLEKAR